MIAKEKARLEHLVFESGGYMSQASTKQFVAVLDFGAQYGQLIARRVRDLNVYSEIVPCDISADELREMAPSALILSGGPASVYAEDAPRVDPAIFQLGVPILGICYGFQTMAHALGGTVGRTGTREYGHTEATVSAGSCLFDGTPDDQIVWMSHGDAVQGAPEGFTVTASTAETPVAAFESRERRLYGLQWHPEVGHSQFGQDALKNFLYEGAGIKPTWTAGSIVDEQVEKIREQVGDAEVICGLSGGVDSAVAAALGKALDREVVEADELISQRAGMSIPEIFARSGEETFRKLETEVLAEQGKRSGIILSTGGGCVTRPENYPLLHQNGTIFRLTRDLAKLPTEGRPISQATDLAQLCARREPLYRRFADVTVSNDGALEATVQTIKEALL